MDASLRSSPANEVDTARIRSFVQSGASTSGSRSPGPLKDKDWWVVPILKHPRACPDRVEKEVLGHYSVVVTGRYTHLRTDLFADPQGNGAPGTALAGCGARSCLAEGAALRSITSDTTTLFPFSPGQRLRQCGTDLSHQG